jgi:hypothetical protein
MCDLALHDWCWATYTCFRSPVQSYHIAHSYSAQEAIMKVVLSSEEILRGLKHYRRIAKQDVLRAVETPNPDAFRVHAEARREVYAQLADLAEINHPDEVVEHALGIYKTLPFLNGTPEDSHPESKGRENALENFFLMIGLDARVRREARRERKPMKQQGAQA